MVHENKNLNGIRLYADKSNIAAHKTYQKLGMIHDHYVTFEWLK
jgi:RimJ/RimL family protein N-acetyltransferase